MYLVITLSKWLLYSHTCTVVNRCVHKSDCKKSHLLVQLILAAVHVVRILNACSAVNILLKCCTQPN